MAILGMDIRERNRSVIELFRAGGEIPGMHRDRLLLLTTKGCRTGEPRTVPIMFVRDESRILVIASNAGAVEEPQRYRNLVADPHVTVEVGDERYEALARPLDGSDRAAAWSTITRLYPFFLDHEVKAARTIPIVQLERIDRPA